MELLRTKLLKLMNEYEEELAIARRTNDFKRPFGKFVRQDIADDIKRFVNHEQYKVKASVGAGRWTDVPWVAVFDKRVTTSAQKGVYIVYLLNKDSKTLYLTLNQGATAVSQNEGDQSAGNLAFTGVASGNNTRANAKLRERANYYRNIIGNKYELTEEGINSGSNAYDAGCIFYKEYTLETLPNDESLHRDLDLFLDVYNDFYEKALKQNDVVSARDWWPTIDEYHPGITKDQWIDLLKRSDIIGPVWGGTLAMFYDYGGAATCTQLGQKYNKDPASIRSSATQLAKKVHDITNCPLFMDNNKEKYWTLLFQGRHAADGEEGSWVWKIRPELSEALKEFNILKFLPKEEENSMSIKYVIDKIENYISINGFTYPDGMIENFYLSLKSKPFVILAGTSGTGKTKLVSLFAEAIGAKMQLVPVRPDWSDSSDLFGHVDLSGKFVPGEIIDFVKEASDNLNTPYILCLDEMNLARVEYYLSDFLSIIETRRFADGEIVTNPLLAKEKYGVGNGAYEYYGNLYLPENLYIVGTVNMDETTFPFSKKVLDRANTIEFSYVDLMPDFTGYGESADSLALDNSFLKTEYLKLAACAEEATFIEEICSELQDMNKVLQAADAHVGYRVRDEIVFYMLNNKKAELIDKDAAMDNEIMQKILPRIQGSSSAVKEMLCELFKIFCSDYRDHQTAGSDLFEQMQKALDAGAKYPESAKKVAFMVRRFDEDGFTSYWL